MLNAIKGLFMDYGYPRIIISDTETAFTFEKFEDFCKKNGIHHTLNSTRRPQGNGLVEGINRTIAQALATYMALHSLRHVDLKFQKMIEESYEILEEIQD